MDITQVVRAFDQVKCNSQGFASIASHSMRAVITQSATRDEVDGLTESPETKLCARLSYPWIVPSPLSGDRLVTMGSRHPLVMAGWFESAHNVGIRVTVFEAQNHVLQRMEALSGNLAVSGHRYHVR